MPELLSSLQTENTDEQILITLDSIDQIIPNNIIQHHLENLTNDSICISSNEHLDYCFISLPSKFISSDLHDKVLDINDYFSIFRTHNTDWILHIYLISNYTNVLFTDCEIEYVNKFIKSINRADVINKTNKSLIYILCSSDKIKYIDQC